jgi:dinuclear metal center YbgI/SA1388 family protein
MWSAGAGERSIGVRSDVGVEGKRGGPAAGGGGVRTAELASYLDGYLRVGELPDEPDAVNGLQVENGGEVTRLAVAVDASERAIAEAVRLGCDGMLVHHGLLWGGNRPVTGPRYRRLRRLLEGDVALYAAHIPLDVHPEVGNNVQLAAALGVVVEGTFGDYRGIPIGVRGRLELRREALAARLQDVLGAPVRFLPGGPERLRTVGIVTGGGGSMLLQAVEAGLDAYVTGEGPHHTYFDAMEGGINAYYAGHYLTETWGVLALGAHLEARFGLPWQFIDQPTGF